MGKTDQGEGKQKSTGRREFGRGPADPTEGMPSELESGRGGKSGSRQQTAGRPGDDEDIEELTDEDTEASDEDEGDLDEEEEDLEEEEQLEGAEPRGDLDEDIERGAGPESGGRPGSRRQQR